MLRCWGDSGDLASLNRFAFLPIPNSALGSDNHPKIFVEPRHLVLYLWSLFVKIRGYSSLPDCLSLRLLWCTIGAVIAIFRWFSPKFLDWTLDLHSERPTLAIQVCLTVLHCHPPLPWILKGYLGCNCDFSYISPKINSAPRSLALISHKHSPIVCSSVLNQCFITQKFWWTFHDAINIFCRNYLRISRCASGPCPYTSSKISEIAQAVSHPFQTLIWNFEAIFNLESSFFVVSPQNHPPTCNFESFRHHGYLQQDFCQWAIEWQEL